MKLQWFVLVLGLGLYILALTPGAPLHRVDILAMIASGILIASLTIIGFDLPFYHRNQGLVFLACSVLILLIGILMTIYGHAYVLFVIAVPVFGLTLLGFQKLKK